MNQNLAQYFQTSLFMSGTPAEFQTVIAKYFSCDCPIYEAVDKKFVCRPKLNLVKCRSSQMNSAVLAVYKFEKEKLSKENKGFCASLKFPSHIIVNCSSIDEVNSLYNEVSKFPIFAEDNVHLISIHSPKDCKNKSLNEDIVKSKIDGETDVKKFINEHIKEINKWLKQFNENERKIMMPKTVMDVLELIDAGVIFKGEPVILFQVDMISEGINLCSFNAGIIKSKAEVKSMQQIGRIIRNYTLDNGKIIRQKKIDGHAHLFAIMENENDIADLMDRLEQFELTSDAFDWGSKIDVSNGSTPDPDDENNLPTLNDFVWEPITDIEIVELDAICKTTKYNQESRHIPTEILANLPVDDMANLAAALNCNVGKIKSNVEKLKNTHKNIEKENKKKNKNEKKINDMKNESNKSKISVQYLINNLRRTIIHNQLKENQPHGWVEWTKYNEDFIFRYLANGNEKYATAITNVLNVLKNYLHLEVNPNK